MTEFTKRILKGLARAAISALCQLAGKSVAQEPGLSRIEARKTQTTSKTTKKRKGELS